MKKLGVLLICLWITNVSASTAKEVTFEKCVDGDTAYFLIDNESTKFRFLGIDTPESVHPKKKEEAFGKQASEFACEMLQNAKTIVVEYDDGSEQIDKYDRHLAWIWVDGELLQKKLIENGFAQVAYIYGEYRYTKNLCAVQKKALEEELNIWSNSSYEEGYCKNIDVTGVSTEITMDMEVESDDSNNIIYYIVAIVVVGTCCLTGKKINVKKIMKKI